MKLFSLFLSLPLKILMLPSILIPCQIITEISEPYNYWRLSDYIPSENTPKLGLTYLHMRKAGGSWFLSFLRNWMSSHGCFGKDVSLSWTLFPGVVNGNIRGHRLNSSKCLSMDFHHEEFSCLGDGPTSLFPHRASRSHLHFSIFTILRHPIDRIGAQAFYGNTVGSLLLTDLINKRCRQGLSSSSSRYPHHQDFNLNHEFNQCNPESKVISSLCQCYYNSLNETIHLLKTNETLWYEWFQTPGFGDQYMSNYYIKRMVSGNPKIYSDAIQCLQSPEMICTGKQLLLELTPSSKCQVVEINVTKALLQAKSLLLTQYDFLILENLSHSTTPYLLASILREKNIELIQKLLQTTKLSNSGLLGHVPSILSHYPNSSALRYSSIFPESILNFLFVDNAEDIALYEYAVKLYHHRIHQVMNSVHPSVRGGLSRIL